MMAVISVIVHDRIEYINSYIYIYVYIYIYSIPSKLRRNMYAGNKRWKMGLVGNSKRSHSGLHQMYVCFLMFPSLACLTDLCLTALCLVVKCGKWFQMYHCF